MFLLILVIVLSVPIVGVSAVSETDIPHFIDANSSRYVGFQAKHPNIPYDVIVAYVNANVDFGFYNGIQTAHAPNSITVLVNKNFVLPDNFAVGALSDIDSRYQMRTEAATQFNNMRKEMNALGLPLRITSAYRSRATQASLHSRAVSQRGVAAGEQQVARPGHSEHQTGLVVDVGQGAGGSTNAYRFQDSAQYRWMRQNAHRYGFILRYPNGLTNIHGYIFESWHWRYIGVAAATQMQHERIQLFEEYYGRYLASGLNRDNFAFIDVANNSIAYDAIRWANTKSFVTGSDGWFSPHTQMTRAQFALVLYRFEGSPPVSEGREFSDVNPASIAYDAIKWASSHGIVTGQDGKFNPNGNITRAQMVLMLNRYNSHKGNDSSSDVSVLDPFRDRGEISSVAIDAMRWGVTQGLVSGGNGLLNPNGNITRAQVVLILRRYDSVFAEN